MLVSAKIVRGACWAGGFLLLVALLDWSNGAFESEFGRHPDEGMHYVTGLLIRDFLTSGQWTHPMQFALEYYAHFPKVGLGNWPPVFELLQAGWGLLFGVSRVSMLWGMAVLAAALATVSFQAAARFTSVPAAAFATAVMLAAPLTQAGASMVMAEIPLALFSFLAILGWVRFAGSPNRRDALAFGLWTTVAIMTKGNGWVVPAAAGVALVLQGKWGLLRKSSLWVAGGVIALICIPYTLVTMSIVVQGWNSHSLLDFPTLLQSLRVHHGFVAALAGLPLYAVMWIGLADRVIAPAFRRSRIDPFWSTLALYGLGIVVFHSLVPTSYEPRKIYQIAPVLCALLAAGLDWLARSITRVLPRVGTVPAQSGAVLLVAAAFVWSGFRWIEPFAPGFVPAVTGVLETPDSRGTAILVASDGTFTDSEAAIIAEWASRQRDAGTYLLRATKFLSHPVSRAEGQVEFEPYDKTPEDLKRRLMAVPVAYVIVHTPNTEHPYAHHALLRTALEQSPGNWERIYSSQGVAAPIEVFHNRTDVRGIPVRFQVDLSEKLGSPVVVGPGE